MHSYTEHNYEADADGNRGRTVKFYELDEEDTPEIITQLTEFIESTGEEPPNPFTVHLITPDTDDDIEFDIDPSTYIGGTK
jgi:hypothetical protein